MNELQEQLQIIQNENLALYDEATTLRQQKNNKEHRDSDDDNSDNNESNTDNINATNNNNGDTTNNNNDNKEPQTGASIEEQIQMLVEQQKKEEATRSAAQKKLQEVLQKTKSLQDSIDQQNLAIQHNLLPKLHNEELALEEYYKNLIESCSKHPNLDTNKLKSLVEQFSTKSKEVFNENEEIEKLHRLIQYNEPHYQPKNEASKEEEEECENPLPCFSSQPPSLEEARTRRRVSFNLQ